MDFIIRFRHWIGRDDLFEVRRTIQLVLYAYRQDFVCALLTILADACHDYRKLISHITWIALTDMNKEETYCILVCEQTFDIVTLIIDADGCIPRVIVVYHGLSLASRDGMLGDEIVVHIFHKKTATFFGEVYSSILPTIGAYWQGVSIALYFMLLVLRILWPAFASGARAGMNISSSLHSAHHTSYGTLQVVL